MPTWATKSFVARHLNINTCFLFLVLADLYKIQSAAVFPVAPTRKTVVINNCRAKLELLWEISKEWWWLSMIFHLTTIKPWLENVITRLSTYQNQNLCVCMCIGTEIRMTITHSDDSHFSGGWLVKYCFLYFIHCTVNYKQIN